MFSSLFYSINLRGHKEVLRARESESDMQTNKQTNISADISHLFHWPLFYCSLVAHSGERRKFLAV